MGITKTASDRFFILSVDSKETSENFILDLSIPISDRKLVSVSPRVFGIRYEVEHLVTGTDMDKLLIVTNKDVAKNNKLMSVDVNKSGDSSLWTDVKAYDNNIQIDDVLPFASYTAIVGRADGLEKVWIAKNSDLSTWNVVSTEESVYSLWCGDNYIFDAKKIRLVYSSLITPKTWFDYDLDSKTKTILKIQDVPSYDKSQYVTKRLYACAKDGRQIPLSIVHHKKVELPTSTVLRTTATTSITITSKSTSAPIPTILYGYGSYGHSIDPVFDYKRIPLLDRGCVYVIAHIRGGGEMGRSWYEDEGKYLSKMNTFTDFGACAKMLIDTGITSNQNLCIVGRSAGGLLVGATVNLFPSLFKAAVADVPFVDALNTMSDPNIPLTVTEWLV